MPRASFRLAVDQDDHEAVAGLQKREQHPQSVPVAAIRAARVELGEAGVLDVPASG
jgi:hypothetical protein